MGLVVNPDGTVDETIVERKPLVQWKLELARINDELDSIRASILKLQTRRDLLQARKADLRAIQEAP